MFTKTTNNLTSVSQTHAAAMISVSANSILENIQLQIIDKTRKSNMPYPADEGIAPLLFSQTI
jgi:hypothetical protein